LIETSNGFDEARSQTRAVYESLKELASRSN
jgi:hypothetical protein